MQRKIASNMFSARILREFMTPVFLTHADALVSGDCPTPPPPLPFTHTHSLALSHALSRSLTLYHALSRSLIHTDAVVSQ